MTEKALPPEVGREIETLKIRVDALERRLSKFFDDNPQEIVFSFAGDLFEQESGPYSRQPPWTTRYVVAELTVAGVTATVVKLKRNGTVITGGTITIPADQTLVALTITAKMAGGDQDRLTAELFTPGNGASGLDVIVRYRDDG